MVDLARQRTARRARIDQAVARASRCPTPTPCSTSSSARWPFTTPAIAPPPSPSSAASCAPAARWSSRRSTRPMDWLRKGGSYFDVKLETDIWHTHRETSRCASGVSRCPLCARPPPTPDSSSRSHRAPPGRHHARALSEGLREAEHRTRVPDSPPGQARPRDQRHLTGIRTAMNASGAPASRFLSWRSPEQESYHWIALTPGPLAEFWAAMLGGEIVFTSAATAVVRTDWVALSAIEVPAYEPPTMAGAGRAQADPPRSCGKRPEGGHHRVSAAGCDARAAAASPERRAVLFDPAGHPRWAAT